MSRDPRLQWRQLSIAQPNTAGLLREMRGGINDAASAAEGILNRYQEGAELKAENELVRRIGNRNQEELRKMFDQGAFDDLNLGKNGLAILNSAMSGAADIDNTNSIIRSRDGRLTIAQNQDKRAATRFGWESDDREDALTRRDWKRAHADLFFEDEQSAFSRGLAPASLVWTESGGNFAARNNVRGAGGKGHFGRLQFSHARFQEAVNAGAVPPGMTIEQFGSDTPEGRAAQRSAEKWHFTDIQNRISESGLDKYIGQKIGGVEITRDGMVAMAHLGGFNGMKRYLESGGQYNPADSNGTSLSDYARIHAGNSSGPLRGGFRPYIINRGGNRYAQAMIDSGLFSGPETLTAIDPLRDAAEAGQTEIDKQRKDYTADVVTGITQNAVSSDNIQPGDLASAQMMIQKALEATGDYSTAEAAGLASEAVKQIENDAALNAEFNRGAASDVQIAIINEALKNAMEQSVREFEGQDQYRALNDIERYSENPTKNLEKDLGIGSDDETPDGYDSNTLRNYINALAHEFNVEPAVIAVAMRDAFIRDPGRGGFPGDWTRNTIKNRFNKEKIAAAVQQLTPQRRAEFDRARSELTINETRLRQNATAQQQIQARLNRMGKNNPQRKSLEKRLDDLVREAAKYSRNTRNP